MPATESVLLSKGVHMGPSTWRGRLAAAITLVAAAVVGLLLIVALAQETYLVDMVPGADAGLATSPALESARARAVASGLILLGLGRGTAGVLVVGAGRKAHRGATGL